MRYFLCAGTAGLAACVIAAALAAMASAFTLENLPESATRTQTENAISATKFTTTGGNEIKCTTATESGTETSSKPPSGAFHLKFSGCKSEKPIKGVTCTGEGDSSGMILILGTWKLVFASNPSSGTLTTAIFMEFFKVDIKCTALVDVRLEGSFLCLHENATVKSISHTSRCEQAAGKQKLTKWWDSAGTEHTAQMTASFNSGVSEETGFDGFLEIVSSAEIFADQ